MSDQQSPRRGGAPRGNQNARKHGIYAYRLSPDEVQAVDCHPEITFRDLGLDDQVLVLRMRMTQLILEPSGSMASFARLMKVFARLLQLQRRRAVAMPDIRRPTGSSPSQSQKRFP